ncbi:MAG: flavodoxin [Lachnospiraceae bacterium]|nr:flavodoxin [Lachnospiraceae bacterium]
MKKTIAILLSMFMILSFAACGNSTDRTGQPIAEDDFAKKDTDDNVNSVEDASDNDADSAEISTNDDMSEKDSHTDDMENAEIPEAQQGEGESSEEQETKVLVAYFSATNTTKGVAEHIADGLHADLYEIVPEEPYTDADLNYNDNNSRTTIEMNDPDVRPAISGSVENMEEYEVVFLGYPIWWAEAPRIINTFLESYDFSGKTIVPFCTSGGSGVGSSATNLQALASDSTVWLDGTRLASTASQSDIEDWLGGLGLNIFEN